MLKTHFDAISERVGGVFERGTDETRMIETQRKLSLNSNPHTGDCNVVPLDVADLVLDNEPPVGGPALPTTGVRHCTLMSSSLCHYYRYWRHPTATAGTSSQHAAPSGPPLEYKDLGNCAHSCQHCGALFWFEERLKSTPRGTRPRYNRCCRAGRVALRTYQIYPEYIKLLLEDRHFLENIRAYNQMFSMTSLGANVDESINNGRGPYVFKISGQLYHWIGSLCPADGEPPRFLQLYIYDTDNEVDNRLTHFGGDNSVLRRDIVEGLIDLLDSHNALVQLFRTAREKLQDTHVPNFKVRLYNVIGAREYELPTGDMLGAIVYEAGPENDMDYDIVLEERSGYPKRVNKLHPSYMSLQFPLLFIYGQDGYSKDLKMINRSGSSTEDKRLTMLVYYSYYLHDRANQYNYLSMTGKLFQKYVVTAYCAVEHNRIDFIRGPRYMYSHYLDALAICRVHGNPLYFITFTCNVNWPEITNNMAQFPLLTITDKADIVDRVFEMKIRQFVNYLRDAQPFGKVVADEFVRPRRDEDINMYVSAELPAQHADPQGYKIVSELMMHGPCGLANPSAP
ncbi:DNA helicase, partial [Tanacetum coccineum]